MVLINANSLVLRTVIDSYGRRVYGSDSVQHCGRSIVPKIVLESCTEPYFLPPVVDDEPNLTANFKLK